jgi:hypothetical protein
LQQRIAIGVRHGDESGRKFVTPCVGPGLVGQFDELI